MSTTLLEKASDSKASASKQPPFIRLGRVAELSQTAYASENPLSIIYRLETNHKLVQKALSRLGLWQHFAATYLTGVRNAGVGKPFRFTVYAKSGRWSALPNDIFAVHCPNDSGIDPVFEVYWYSVPNRKWSKDVLAEVKRFVRQHRESPYLPIFKPGTHEKP
jgi:hypothetical protein